MIKIMIAIASLFFMGYKDRDIGQKSKTPMKVCVQPADKSGRIKPNHEKHETVQPYCPNPEIAQTPTPTKHRRVEK